MAANGALKKSRDLAADQEGPERLKVRITTVPIGTHLRVIEPFGYNQIKPVDTDDT